MVSCPLLLASTIIGGLVRCPEMSLKVPSFFSYQVRGYQLLVQGFWIRGSLIWEYVEENYPNSLQRPGNAFCSVIFQDINTSRLHHTCGTIFSPLQGEWQGSKSSRKERLHIGIGLIIQYSATQLNTYWVHKHLEGKILQRSYFIVFISDCIIYQLYWDRYAFFIHSSVHNVLMFSWDNGHVPLLQKSA